MTSIEQCHEQKKALDALRPLSVDDEQRIMQKFRLDWNYHSNHLEGNTLTYGETKALILFGITAQGKPLKDHFEITGHNDAINYVIEIVKEDRPLTEQFIKDINQIILKESYEVDAITPDGKPTKKRIAVGEYKTTPNHVKTKTGEIFRFATPAETPAKMGDLIAWFRKESEAETPSPILLAAKFHYNFIRIHPFDDGNGRTARLLMNLILMQHGYPPVIIKTEDKETYFAVLRQADAGVIEPFINYIADNLKHSLNIMLAGANGESIEEPEDIDKELALLEQQFFSAGENIEKVKSKETLQALFEGTIIPLDIRFRALSDKLDKFYVESNKEYYLKSPTKIYNSLTSLLVKVNEKSNEIRIMFSYNYLRRNNFSKDNFQTEIAIELKDEKYKVVFNPHGNIFLLEFDFFEKPYHINLTSEEIDYVVNTEIRRHMAFIQSKLKEIDK